MDEAVVSELVFFRAFEEEPYGYAREAAAQGVRVAGVMCSYAPVELLHAAGYFPVRILGRAGAASRADELLQRYACSFARSTFDRALSGELDFLSVALFSHTCDTMQNLGDLWERNCPNMTTLIVSPPHATDTAAARAYFLAELRRIQAALETLAGPISPEKLGASIALYAEHRAVMQQLFAYRRAHPGVLGGRDYMAVVNAAFLAPRERHLEHLKRLLAVLPERPAAVDCGPKVLVAGSLCQNSDFIGVLEGAGCCVVGDDLCMGTRSFCMAPRVAEASLEGLAALYLERPPCAAFHCSSFDPAAHLVEAVRRDEADGVVFLLTKFCDPWGFDYPAISKRLEALDIPFLMVEVEQNAPTPEQYKTRAEAFFELLAARREA